MFRRFLSLITFAGLLLLASGTNLFGQTRGCPPTTPRTLTPATEDPEQRLPAAQLMAHLADGFQGTIFIPSDITVEMGSERELTIGPCVTLKGTRGGLDPGALVNATHLDLL